MHPLIPAFQALPQVAFVAEVKGEPLFVHAFTAATYRLTHVNERTGVISSERIPAIAMTVNFLPPGGKGEPTTEVVLTRQAGHKVLSALQLEAACLKSDAGAASKPASVR